MTHPLAQKTVQYTRDPLQVRTNYTVHEIADSPFLFLNQHEKQYNNKVSQVLYRSNPDHYWDQRLNNKPLTKKDTCNGIPDIRKIFFSERNGNILAHYIHKRVVCHALQQYHQDKIPQIKTIYPAIQASLEGSGGDSAAIQANAANDLRLIRKTFSPKNLQPYMDRTYRIYGQYISDNIQKQLDKLNYIVIVECSNKILKDISFHLYYLADTNGINRGVVGAVGAVRSVSSWDRPMNASNSISYTLPSQT